MNISRNSMTAVVLFFTKSNATDNEKFVFPNLTNVNITVEGNPNDIYSSGLAKRDMYREAVRFLRPSTNNKYVSQREFYTNKFAFVINFRTIDYDSVSESGRKLVSTQAGILMEVEKEATTADLSCNIFVIFDAVIDIIETKLNGTAQY